MADGLDPVRDHRIEASLHRALHAEAASIPFTLRPETLRRVHAERRRARRAQLVSLLAAAAVLVVAVGAIGVTLTLRGAPSIAQQPTPSTSSTPLSSADAASVSPGAATPDANGLLPFPALQAVLAEAGVAYQPITAEHPTTEAGSTARTWTVGTVAAGRVGIAVSCSGGSLTISVLVGDQRVASSDDQCAGRVELQTIDPSVMTAKTTGQVVVEALPSVRWRLVAGVDATAPPALSTLPSPSLVLAAAGQGAVRLDAREGGTGSTGEVVNFSSVKHRGSLALVIACRGGGNAGVGVAFADAPLSSDAASDPATFGGAASCDGTPQVMPWDGWNSTILSGGVTVGLAVPASTAYRAVLVDTSVLPSDGEQTAVADGLPTIEHIAAARSDVGFEIAAHELLGRASGSGTEVAAADIRVSTMVRVTIACVGGTADVTIASPDQTVGNATTTSGSSLGSPVCDGTMQAFDWTRTDGPADAASVVVTAAAGTSWRTVVLDMAGGPRSSAPPSRPGAQCSSTTGLKLTPPATLYQGTRALTTVQYYSSQWSSTSETGVPVVPTESSDAKTDVPLQLRVAGGACATRWSVVYGTPNASGFGLDPVGLLTALPNVNSDNRVDLASLPPGDWVLEINLGFDKGSGVGLLRVHVTG